MAHRVGTKHTQPQSAQVVFEPFLIRFRPFSDRFACFSHRFFRFFGVVVVARSFSSIVVAVDVAVVAVVAVAAVAVADGLANLTKTPTPR